MPALGGGGLGGDDYIAAFLWVAYMVVTILLLIPGEFYFYYVYDPACVGQNANPTCPPSLHKCLRQGYLDVRTGAYKQLFPCRWDRTLIEKISH
jgi:hypothetical protein